MSAVQIVSASLRWFESYYFAVDSVAREQIYIEMIEAPQVERVREFQSKSIANNWPNFYALDGQTVVGWADITPLSNPRLAHRGGLGMGLISTHRRRGIGTRLLDAVLSHSAKIGLEKIELHVYTDNVPAISLYEKLGFEVEGRMKRYRKLNGRSFDCLLMAKFL